MAAIELFHSSPLERVRRLVTSRIGQPEGKATLVAPDLCLWRLSTATTVRKTETFGVTLDIVLQGQKTLRIGRGDEILVDAGRMCVITSQTEHISLEISADERLPFVAMGICFKAERVARALLELADAGEITTAGNVAAFVMATDVAIADALERLLRTLDDAVERKLIAPLIVDEILYRMLRSESAAAIRGAVARTPDAVRILESMRYIEAHVADKLTVEQLARHAGMSSSHYAHRFTAVARISPMRFLREARLERARTLLVESGARAKEVAATVGFESPAHFTREFKRRFGMAPTHYVRTRLPRAVLPHGL